MGLHSYWYLVQTFQHHDILSVMCGNTNISSAHPEGDLNVCSNFHCSIIHYLSSHFAPNHIYKHHGGTRDRGLHSTIDTERIRCATNPFVKFWVR